MAVLISLLSFGGLFLLFTNWSGFGKMMVNIPAGTDTLRELGSALVSPNAFVIPFEVASVLLLAALIGAVYVSFRGK